MSIPKAIERKSPLVKALPLLTAALLLLWPHRHLVSRAMFHVTISSPGTLFLDSPHVSLFENGFHFQAGVRPKTWYSLGFDYSISGGSLTLTPNLLTPV